MENSTITQSDEISAAALLQVLVEFSSSLSGEPAQEFQHMLEHFSDSLLAGSDDQLPQAQEAAAYIDDLLGNTVSIDVDTNTVGSVEGSESIATDNMMELINNLLPHKDHDADHDHDHVEPLAKSLPDAGSSNPIGNATGNATGTMLAGSEAGAIDNGGLLPGDPGNDLGNIAEGSVAEAGTEMDADCPMAAMEEEARKNSDIPQIADETDDQAVFDVPQIANETDQQAVFEMPEIANETKDQAVFSKAMMDAFPNEANDIAGMMMDCGDNGMADEADMGDYC